MQLRSSLIRLLPYFVIFVFGVAFNQYYGYLGYMPLDQSIVYNGGWRILNGQIPYVDFWVPYGLTPILIQAAIFRSIGVTWTNYVLHASLLNAFFATCVMFAGIRLGLKLPIAVVYALIAALIAYPPMGTPFVDQHAAIISSLVFLVVVLGITEPDKRRVWWWLAPPLSILAFLSKQVPSIYVVLFCGVTLIAVAWFKGYVRDLRHLFYSATISSLLVVSIFYWADISSDMFRIQTIDSARAIAEERANLGEAGENMLLAAFLFLWALAPVCAKLAMLRIGPVPIFLLSGVTVVVALAFAIRAKNFEAIVLSAFSGSLLLILLAFSSMTNNQPATGLALLVIVFLLSHSGAIRTFGDRRLSHLFVVLPVIVAASIQLGWTAPRSLNDFNFSSDFDRTRLTNDSDAISISPQLTDMVWAIPDGYGERKADNYHQLIIELRKRSNPTVFFSDGILDALLGQKPITPALFWHKKLSYPARGHARALFDNQFKRAIVDGQSDLVVVDGSRTWMGSSYSEFSWLAGCLLFGQSRSIGKFSLIPLDITCVRSTL